MVRTFSGGMALVLLWSLLAAGLPQAEAQIILLPCPDCPPDMGQPIPIQSGLRHQFLEPGDDDPELRDVALFEAIRDGHLSYVQALAAAGVSLTHRDQNGLMPLAWAAQYGRLDILNYLLARGVPRNPMDHYGFTPLMWAAQQGQRQVVRALLLAGANPRVRTRRGVDALALARVARHVSVEALLLDALAGRLTPPTPLPSPGVVPTPPPPTPRPLPSLAPTAAPAKETASPVASGAVTLPDSLEPSLGASETRDTVASDNLTPVFEGPSSSETVSPAPPEAD